MVTLALYSLVNTKLAALVSSQTLSFRTQRKKAANPGLSCSAPFAIFSGLSFQLLEDPDRGERELPCARTSVSAENRRGFAVLSGFLSFVLSLFLAPGTAA